MSWRAAATGLEWRETRVIRVMNERRRYWGTVTIHHAPLRRPAIEQLDPNAVELFILRGCQPDLHRKQGRKPRPVHTGARISTEKSPGFGSGGTQPDGGKIRTEGGIGE